MNRKDFLAIAAVFLLNAGVPIAAAASGPSLKPTRIGQTVIWRGKKYTAVKSGRKLIWNKAVALQKADRQNVRCADIRSRKRQAVS